MTNTNNTFKGITMTEEEFAMNNPFDFVSSQSFEEVMKEEFASEMQGVYSEGVAVLTKDEKAELYAAMNSEEMADWNHYNAEREQFLREQE